MSLADLTLQDDYRSSTDDLVDAFYIPCLAQATRYDRAVGYFTSASMALVARGLTAFIQAGGQMRLVTSPHLMEDDVAAIAQLEQEIQKHQLVEEKQILAQRRVAAAEEVMSRLAQVQENYSVWFRAQLEQRIQEVFGKISITAYTPRLNEKYELTLEDSTTGRPTPVVASQGESQILSLSFIGAIVDKVREWSQDKRSSLFMGPDSNVFPLVMDSPFGALDAVHRRQVARSLPVLANQLVVLVSKTQWRDEVEKEMDERIGKMYVLSYHSPKAELEPDEMVLKGGEYPLVRRSVNEFEWTEVLAVM